jgi:hypothetical protein
MKRLILLTALIPLSACIGYKDSSRDISPTLGEAERHNVAVQAEAARTDESTTDGARAAQAVNLYRSNRTTAPSATRVSDVGASTPSAPR